MKMSIGGGETCPTTGPTGPTTSKPPGPTTAPTTSTCDVSLILQS